MAALVLNNQGFEYAYNGTYNASTGAFVSTQDYSPLRDYYLTTMGVTTIAVKLDTVDSDTGALDGSGDITFPGTFTLVATSTDAVLIKSGVNDFYLVSNVPQTFPVTLTPYDGNNSQFIGPLAPCFARGTLITTPDGERPVETLAIGDLVTTINGTAPVRWIGRQTRHVRFARREQSMPVCIRAGALGEGLPRRDLFVSPDHAMLVDGVLVHALALCNGVSIVQMNEWPQESVEYFHIELENHDLVFAEGSLSETFVDNLTRKAFDNWREYAELYGEESAIPELPLPRVKCRRQLAQRTKQRLLALAQVQHVA